MTRIWFKRKQYGWGWYPSTWQGWMVILGFVVAEVFAGVLLSQWAAGDDAAFVRVFVPVTFLLVAIMTLISWHKGESPRWQWGGK